MNSGEARQEVISGIRSAIAVSHAVRRQRAARRPAPDGGFEAALDQLDPDTQRAVRAIVSIEQYSLRDYSRQRVAYP